MKRLILLAWISLLPVSSPAIVNMDSAATMSHCMSLSASLPGEPIPLDAHALMISHAVQPAVMRRNLSTSIPDLVMIALYARYGARFGVDTIEALLVQYSGQVDHASLLSLKRVMTALGASADGYWMDDPATLLTSKSMVALFIDSQKIYHVLVVQSPQKIYVSSGLDQICTLSTADFLRDYRGVNMLILQ